MNRYKAIATDIDGTLLDIHRELSGKTIRVIRQLGPDFPVVLASSRMPKAMRHLQAQLGIEHHPLICYNGGYVIRYSENKAHVISSTEIANAMVVRITQLASATSLHLSLYRNDEWFAPAGDEWTEREERITKVKATIRPLKETLEVWAADEHGAHKVMCMGKAEEISWLKNEVDRGYARDVHAYLSRPTYLELAPGSISKGTALKLLIENLYDFPMKNVLAFGDNYNDIDMLRVAGLGISVANGREEVKAVAGELTGKSIDDGVADAIEKHCFHREN